MGHDRRTFNKIAHYFNATHLTTESNNVARTSEYNSIVGSIRDNRSRVIDDLDEIQRIRSWLERRQDEINVDSQQRNLAKHMAGTGEWLFEETKFRSWASLDKSFPIVWLVGPEGCGKSLLCSLAIERMRLNTQQQAVVDLMLAFDKPRSEYHLVTQTALQLLKYVIEHRGGVNAEAFLMLPREQSKDKKTFQVRELIQILISQCPAVFIFVDGLDEVGSAEQPEQKLNHEAKLEKTKRQLHSVVAFFANLTKKESGTPVRLLCSSKQTVTIENWMREWEALELPINRHAVAADIAQYVERRFKNGLGGSSSTLASTSLIAQLSKAAKNSFLFASTMADWIESSFALTDSSTEPVIPDKFKSIGELYQERLDQLLHPDSPHEHNMEQKSLGILQTISLVANAKRPLKLMELQEALAISQKSFQDGELLDLTSENIEHLNGREVQHDCAPFIDFHPTSKDSKDGFVRLAHASAFVFLREYPQRTVDATEKKFGIAIRA
ncbi:hypothetical protein EJ04DRAFT_82194 [Polyplosphaeria fusca]|uniref:Nephrocystin 3-like N-terminal domain-containing protein n=1 Tax=Polyplosphaeria fusca TaxID=682080 RepID=A0A9P4UUN0_9PLEO|nr:hypothetical protein EJ04DRAFT_82194 [Polyplosphaeria fusca]